MANNAIALQIRAPRGVDMGSVIQQNAMAINQVAQQQAAQRQAAKDQQAMELARAKETRETATAKADLLSKAAGLLRDGFVNYAKFGDEPAIQATRQFVIDMFPTLNLDKVIPPAHVLATDENRYNQAYMTAEQWANKNFGTATTSTVIDPTTNEVKVVNASGLPGKSFSATIPDISRDIRPTPNPTAPAAGAAAPPPAAALSDDQLNAAAQAVVRGANISDPALRNVPQEQFGEVQRRAQQMGAQSEPPAELRPMSYSPEGQQPDLGKIVQTMMDTGVVSQSDVDAMRQAAGPGKDAQLAELLRANNIRIMPNEGMPGARNAVYNPDEGAASMQESDYAPSAYPATYGKPPMQSPMPGSAQVPLPRVRAQAQAERESPQEAAAKTTAQETAKAAVAARAEEAKRLRDQRAAAELFMRTAGVNMATGADPVADLIKKSTSGTIERIGADIMGAIPSDYGGGATEGAKAIGELETISAKLTSDLLQGKLGTGISNEDRNMIQRMLADMSNPDVPSGKRLAAWNRVKQIQASYLNAATPGAAQTGQPWWGQVVRTGRTRDGQLVRQYSNGKIEYVRP